MRSPVAFLILVPVLCLLAAAPASRPASRPADPNSGLVLKTEFGPVEILPRDNPWNTPIDKAKVHPRSDAYLKN